LPYRVYFLLFIFLNFSHLYSSVYYDRIDYVKEIVRYDDSLNIKIYKKVSKEDTLFLENYWKIYYYKDKIIAEELYQKNRLVYYYWYYYTPEKIYQTGYFWNGIYTDIVYFKAHDKYIKQGWPYNNLPDVYKVYNAKDNSLIYNHIYNLRLPSK